MTAQEIGRSVANAYINSKYDIKNITVYNAATGLPLEGASVDIYADWYSFNSNNDTTFAFVTDSNGETSKTRLDKEAYYYYSVSYPGFTSNNSNNFYNADNYGQVEDEYYLYPIPS